MRVKEPEARSFEQSLLRLKRAVWNQVMGKIDDPAEDKPVVEIADQVWREWLEIRHSGLST